MAAQSVYCSRVNLGVPTGAYCWIPPPRNVYRLDIAAAADWEKNRFGFGAVIKDWNGVVKAVLVAPSCYQTSVVEAEICAIMYGIGLSLQEELGPIVMYSKSLLTVRNLNDKEAKGACRDEGFLKIQELCNDGWILNIGHMYNGANSLAHSLALYGAFCNRMFSWNHDFPPLVRDIIIND